MVMRNVVVVRIGATSSQTVEQQDLVPGPPSQDELDQINKRASAQAKADTEVREKLKLRKMIEYFEKEGLV